MKVDTYLMFKSFSVTYYYSILFGWMPIRIPKNENEKVFLLSKTKNNDFLREELIHPTNYLCIL